MRLTVIATSLMFALPLCGCGAAPHRLAAQNPAAQSLAPQSPAAQSAAAQGPAAQTPPAPPAPPQAVNGAFKGRAILGVRLSPACPGSSIGTVQIGDQRLYFAYKPDTLFVAAIQPDGTFHAASGPSLLDGSLEGDRLLFTVRTYVCSSVYQLHRLS